jgi:hypothetical protein
VKSHFTTLIQHLLQLAALTSLATSSASPPNSAVQSTAPSHNDAALNTSSVFGVRIVYVVMDIYCSCGIELNTAYTNDVVAFACNFGQYKSSISG